MVPTSCYPFPSLLEISEELKNQSKPKYKRESVISEGCLRICCQNSELKLSFQSVNSPVSFEPCFLYNKQHEHVLNPTSHCISDFVAAMKGGYHVWVAGWLTSELSLSLAIYYYMKCYFIFFLKMLSLVHYETESAPCG